MKLFFGEINSNAVILDEDEQQHILKVLRMKSGAQLYITDGKGNLAEGTLRIEGKKTNVEVAKIQFYENKFIPKLHIAIAPTKNIDRIDFFVEKATEMGISEISFLLTEKSERKNINIDKIRKKVAAASKQSLRYHFPKVNEMQKLSSFLEQIDTENTFLAHCDKAFERADIKTIGKVPALTFLVGPEGDFSPNEIKILSQRGIKAVSLGSQRLRTETAGVFLAAWNYYQMI